MSSEGMEATEQEILESFDDNDEDAVLDPVDGADPLGEKLYVSTGSKFKHSSSEWA
jgi:hypothetical protein